MMFEGVKLLLLATAFLCLIQHHCNATDCASSCGNIKINYPFRLKTDPSHCGHKSYELACEDKTVILYPNLRGKLKGTAIGYPVRAINYNNMTIRLSDPNIQMDNCALPNVTTVLAQDFVSDLYWTGYWQYSVDIKYLPNTNTFDQSEESLVRMLYFISCPHPMARSVHNLYSSRCNLNRYWYLQVGFEAFELENRCRIEAMALTSLIPDAAKNISYIDVIHSLSYGFELSWQLACCAAKATPKIYNCSTIQQFAFTCDGNWNRDTMTNGFNTLFSLFHKLRDTSIFSDIFVSLNNTLGGKYVYDRNGDLTVFGLILNFLLAILISFKQLSCILGVICVTIFLIYKWRTRHLSAYDNVEQFLQSHQNYLMPIRYSYLEIRKITKGFKEKLGEGGYGSVYKGKLRSGRLVAIKMLGKSKADGQDFINEVASIGRIHHVNVVKLIGYCVEGSKHALVYDFMDNGSLDKHIFSKEGGLPINNKMLFDISLGVARGIEYLHEGCDIQILHFDIKPHNILLDENFIPKISDFGLAKLHSTDHSIVSLTAIRGTLGYIAPEFFYKNIGGISYKADVYSFGMLLMEMVRRKNTNDFTEHSSQIYFPSWIYDQLIEQKKDIKFREEIDDESNMVKKMIIVSLWCIQLNPVNRPSMHKVVEMLEGEVECLKMPLKPFYAPQETPTNDAGLNTIPSISLSDVSSDYSNTISLLIS